MLRNLICTTSLFLVICSAGARAEDNNTAPEHIYEKVQSAAVMLAEKGEAGLKEISDPNGAWVWDTTYVFVLNCNEQMIVAHPTQPELVGRDFTEIRDSRGSDFSANLCMASKAPEGGWVEYWWPIPGLDLDRGRGFRKLTLMMPVEGKPFQVGAGVYDESISIWDLNKFPQ